MLVPKDRRNAHNGKKADTRHDNRRNRHSRPGWHGCCINDNNHAICSLCTVLGSETQRKSVVAGMNSERPCHAAYKRLTKDIGARGPIAGIRDNCNVSCCIWIRTQVDDTRIRVCARNVRRIKGTDINLFAGDRQGREHVVTGDRALAAGLRSAPTRPHRDEDALAPTVCARSKLRTKVCLCAQGARIHRPPHKVIPAAVGRVLSSGVFDRNRASCARIQVAQQCHVCFARSGHAAVRPGASAVAVRQAHEHPAAHGDLDGAARVLVAATRHKSVVHQVRVLRERQQREHRADVVRKAMVQGLLAGKRCHRNAPRIIAAGVRVVVRAHVDPKPAIALRARKVHVLGVGQRTQIVHDAGASQQAAVRCAVGSVRQCPRALSTLDALGASRVPRKISVLARAARCTSRSRKGPWWTRGAYIRRVRRICARGTALASNAAATRNARHVQTVDARLIHLRLRRIGLVHLDENNVVVGREDNRHVSHGVWIDRRTRAHVLCVDT
eukprot:Opistho-2@21564